MYPEVIMRITEKVWESVIKKTNTSKSSVHGASHWVRVERNGVYIAQNIGADEVVVSLFALFHDCRRVNDGLDPEHGLRGAKFAESMRNEMDFLTDKQFEKLYYACKWHTDKNHTDDLTIGACWDADRLDLGRVGTKPRVEFLNTKPARKIIRTGNFEILEAIILRPM